MYNMNQLWLQYEFQYRQYIKKAKKTAADHSSDTALNISLYPN